MNFQRLFRIVTFLFVGYFTLLPDSSYAQNDDEEYIVKAKKITPARRNKKNVIKAIKQLKEGGAMLYMIHDRKMNTAMLAEKGMEHKAIEIEKKQYEMNLWVMKSLAKRFKFCPIYFFFQSDLEKIQNGQIEGNLVDTNYVKNPAIKFDHKYFLIMEYGNVYHEPGKVYYDTLRSDVSGLMSLKNSCFVIKNKYLSQLTDPFPFYVTCHYPKKELIVRIRKLNQVLYKFYNKHQ